MGQIDDIQAQLGNLLSGLPSKLQKVDSSYLDISTPPFEGAIVSDANGQFYISDSDENGNIQWKVVKDVTARQENLAEDSGEVTLKFDVPQGFSSGTISFGTTFAGEVSVFVQYEPPSSGDFVMYVTAVRNITPTGFDLYFSDTVSEAGGIVHILAKGTESSAVSASGGDSSNDGGSSGGDSDAPEPEPTLSDVVAMSPEFWWDWGDSYSDASATTPAAGGDLVMSVADQSSNNRILTASTAGYAPELQTDGANGQPYVDSGTHSCRFKWIADADISGPACVYMVMKDYSNANLTFWNNPSSGASFFNVNTDGTAPDIFRTTFGSDGNYGAAVLTPEVKIYQIYASGTEVGIRVNGGAIHPHWAPSETITPVVENFTSAGELMYLPYGAKVQFYEFGFIPDVTHDQDKVFRYLGNKYDIDVTDVS